MFGGSIGPEAGLTGVVAGLCSWVGDRLKFVGAEMRELANAGTAAILSTIFSAPLFGLAAPLFGYADDADGRRHRIDSSAATVVSAPQVSKPVKTAVYLLSVAGALGAFMLLNEVAGGGSGLPHFSAMAVGTSELAWALPVVALGACAGWLFHGFGWAVGKLSARLGDRVVVKAVVAGAILGVLGIFLPFTLFAGEAQTEMLAQQWTALGAGACSRRGFSRCWPARCASDSVGAAATFSRSSSRGSPSAMPPPGSLASTRSSRSLSARRPFWAPLCASR